MLTKPDRTRVEIPSDVDKDGIDDLVSLDPTKQDKHSISGGGRRRPYESKLAIIIETGIVVIGGKTKFDNTSASLQAAKSKQLKN